MKSLFKILILILIVIPYTAWSKEIKLYEEPKDTSKVVATVNLASGIMPIFTPKNSDWVKVADPKNGNVGWAKASDLNNAGLPQTSFTFSSGPSSYRIIQYGQPNKLSPKEAELLNKRMQLQQKSMQNMIKNMNQLFNDEWNMMNTGYYPVMMPVIIFPGNGEKKDVN